MKRASRWLNRRSLATRLVVSFVALVATTLLAVGLPALRLFDGELARQSSARLEQGTNVTSALYAARLGVVQSLVTLSAERPTLQRLLRQQDQSTFPAYLETLRHTAQLDGLAVLDNQGQRVAQAPATAEALPTLGSGARSAVRPLSREGQAALALVAQAPVRTDEGDALGTVVGFVFLDQPFLAQLKQETGLDHTLWQGEARLTSTLPAPLPRLPAPPSPAEAVWLGGDPFYLRPLALDEGAQVVDVLALPARDRLEARQRIIQVVGGSSLLIATLAAGLAYLLARHITAPLQQLVRASEEMGRGNLESPIRTRANIREVTTLARTLEGMRQRLQRAYGDLQRAKQWSESLIASLSEGVLTVDAGGRITSFSPGAERLLGWRGSDVIGRPYSALFTPHPNPLPTPLIQPTPAPGSVTRQTILARSGAPMTVLITSGAVTPQPEGGWEQAYVFRDVTEEERAQRLREFLLANISHEFKTPLAALHAAVELLATEGPSLDEAQRQELIASVWQGTLRLEELVDNLLSSASLHTGHFVVHPRPTDLETIVEEVLLATRPLLRARQQRLWVEAPSPLRPVLADPRRLAQVFVNLLSNASKYGPPGAPILLRVREQPEGVRVEVEDRGPGIPPDLQPRLFQPFSRREAEDRGGIGLGLSIVRAIVERHGGTVGIERPAEGGTRVWFTLRVAPREEDA